LYDFPSNCIEIGLKKGIDFFDKYTLWELRSVSNIPQFGGRYREETIYVGNHFPPHFRDVPNATDRSFSVVHELGDPGSLLPALLEAGRFPPGSKIATERIREDRKPYYDAPAGRGHRMAFPNRNARLAARQIGLVFIKALLSAKDH
jgi:hypothetical protein